MKAYDILPGGVYVTNAPKKVVLPKDIDQGPAELRLQKKIAANMEAWRKEPNPHKLSPDEQEVVRFAPLPNYKDRIELRGKMRFCRVTFRDVAIIFDNQKARLTPEEIEALQKDPDYFKPTMVFVAKEKLREKQLEDEAQKRKDAIEAHSQKEADAFNKQRPATRMRFLDLDFPIGTTPLHIFIEMPADWFFWLYCFWNGREYGEVTAISNNAAVEKSWKLIHSGVEVLCRSEEKTDHFNKRVKK